MTRAAQPIAEPLIRERYSLIRERYRTLRAPLKVRHTNSLPQEEHAGRMKELNAQASCHALRCCADDCSHARMYTHSRGCHHNKAHVTEHHTHAELQSLNSHLLTSGQKCLHRRSHRRPAGRSASATRSPALSDPPDSCCALAALCLSDITVSGAVHRHVQQLLSCVHCTIIALSLRRNNHYTSLFPHAPICKRKVAIGVFISTTMCGR